VDCLRKLSEYLDTQKPEGFIFNSESQDYYSELDPFELELLFESMHIFHDRRTIMLAGLGDVILRSVMDVEIEIQESCLGDLITITCAYPECADMTRKYKIISVLR